MKRVQTGVEGFDTRIQGGLPEKTNVLLMGTYGSGKSLFSLQYIYSGAKKGEKGLYITMEQEPHELKEHAQQIGLSEFEELENDGKINFLHIPIEEINSSTLETIKDTINSQEVDRVVVDSISVLIFNAPVLHLAKKTILKEIGREDSTGVVSLISEADVKHNFIYNFMRVLKNTCSTNLLISEIKDGVSADGISEYAADGVVKLGINDTLDTRSLKISKMHHTAHSLKPINMSITSEGIKLG